MKDYKQSKTPSIDRLAIKFTRIDEVKLLSNAKVFVKTHKNLIERLRNV